MLQKCIYPPASLCMSDMTVSRKQKTEPCLPTPPLRIQFPFTNPRSNLEQFLQSRMSPYSPLVFLGVESNRYCHAENDHLRLSDVDLFQHYIQHASRTSNYSQRDQMAMHTGIPTLALRDEAVLHSLLALSAACLGCDMISRYPPADLTFVNQVVICGYRHFNLASENLRKLISQVNQKMESLLASNMLLVSFSAAIQQIIHWMSSRNGSKKLRGQLSSTPSDFIVIMRGMRTILQALDRPDMKPDPEGTEDVQHATDDSGPLEFNAVPAALSKWHTHVMFPILASTSQEAFAQLQARLDLAERNASDEQYPKPLSACVAAFEILDNIRIATFSSSNPPALASPTNKARAPLVLKQLWSPRVVSWLRGFARSPAKSLTRMLLSFIAQVPQSYLVILMPLLDQRLDASSTASSDGSPTQLTVEQVLALDIYAHWCVLVFLIEEVEWWIGALPVVILTGMIDRYGDEFVASLQPEEDWGPDRWWPKSMLTVLRELKGGSIP